MLCLELTVERSKLIMADEKLFQRIYLKCTQNGKQDQCLHSISVLSIFPLHFDKPSVIK